MIAYSCKSKKNNSAKQKSRRGVKRFDNIKYVGIATQQAQNNIKSILLLLAFPLLLLSLLYVACYALAYFDVDSGVDEANNLFFALSPLVLGCVVIWFFIAYFMNVKIIDYATGARPLQRKENPRVYNLVENLCISRGMTTPNIHIIDDNALNAFASGVSTKSYTITLTRGIIEKLDDSELEAVIAHELMHIRNNDVRVLIVSIVFVGIFALISEISMRMFFSAGRSSRRGGNNGGGAAALILLVFVLAIVGYCVSMLMRFAISRKREYMADAGAAELTRNPLALAGALRKISGQSCLLKKQEECVAQLFIEHNPPEKRNLLTSVFATHPPIAKRIAILEQF